MNSTLSAWNEAEEATALETMLACCGAHRWAESMVELRPFSGVEILSLTADEVWSTMDETDWLQAFACHPRIGERKAVQASRQSSAWSRQEQSSSAAANNFVLTELAAGNALYEQRFGFTYIVCATGKSAEELLSILHRRLGNDRETELQAAAEQQRQIMQLRIGKWLGK
ncbi:MAG TPA: 2-oxo-4-hydroxy-4-carboxy-5-ureidoimidazoline decarboxylase [Terracidiphilus sp.]|jgi:OHCU decarboxylase